MLALLALAPGRLSPQLSEPLQPRHEPKMPTANLTPLSELTSLGMRNESLIGLAALHADGPVCPATLAHSERLLVTLNALPERNPAPG